MSLSKQETVVLLQVCEDKTSQQIADDLHVSVKTVEAHRHNMMKKLKTKTIVGVVMWGIRNGVITFPELITLKNTVNETSHNVPASDGSYNPY